MYGNIPAQICCACPEEIHPGCDKEGCIHYGCAAVDSLAGHDVRTWDCGHIGHKECFKNSEGCLICLS